MKKRGLLIIALLTVLTARGADFFSTSQSETLFDIGVRLGVNTSNRTVSPDAMPGYNHQSWGTGFDIGAVVDINIRDYFAVQPGIYFETRSGNYTFVVPFEDAVGKSLNMTQSGSRRDCNLTIPVMASFRFNISDNIRWIAEAGPYLSFVLGSSQDNKVLLVDGTGIDGEVPVFSQKPSTVDFGFRLGTGLLLSHHYYLGIHYSAGALNAYKDRRISNLKQVFGGRTKSWLFTIGYNF